MEPARALILHRTLLTISALGTLLFGVLLAMTWTHPHVLEAGLREVLRIEVEQQVGERLDALSDSKIAGLARRALGRVDADLALREEQLRRDVPAQVARVVADMTDADCTCRRKLEMLYRQGLEADIGRLGDARARLSTLVETTYARVAYGLLRDARIVFMTNALAFIAIGVLALVRRKAGLHLLAPTSAILLAVVVTFWSYLFKQDWLHTLIYADFTGMAYVAWFGAVFAFLLDILMNRGRVTTVILNVVFGAVGAALSVVPC